MLRIRTSQGMVSLSDEEAAQLRARLRRVPAAQPAEETIEVSANASTSVSFTQLQRDAVLEVLDQWLHELGEHGMGAGPVALRNGLVTEREREREDASRLGGGA